MPSLSLISLCILLMMTSSCHAASLSTNKGGLDKGGREQSSTISCSLADIIFVLDSSGSIGKANWKKTLKFVKDIVSEIEVSKAATHIGMLTFGNRAHVQFNLTAYDNKDDILSHVDKFPWLDEKTNTSGAIDVMDKMFHKQGRKNAPKLAIVMTDGSATTAKNLTIPNALKAKKKGIVIMCVGIGDKLNETELRDIASNESLVLKADSFDTLRLIQSSVVQIACDIPTDCMNYADIMFVLDSSGSVKADNFQKMKDFLKNMLEQLNVAEDQSNVGVMTFSDAAEMRFDLNAFHVRQDIQAAIDKIDYKYGTTNTADALRKLRTQAFTRARGDRPQFPNIVVIFTDGGSNDFEATILEARKARASGMTVLVVAVSAWVNYLEINQIASDPDDANVFLVSRFDEIGRITAGLKAILCDQVNECLSNPCQNGGTCRALTNKYICECRAGWAGYNCDRRCPDAANIVFALDSSGSIGQDNYYVMLDFVKSLISSFNMRQTRVGIETFANNKVLQFHLDEYISKWEVMNAISFPYSRGTTNTAAALDYLKTMFMTENGARANSRKFGIVVTDGESNDRGVTFSTAVDVRGQEITLLSVGVNMKSALGQKELQGIASDPDSANVFNVAGFSALFNISDTLLKTVCNTENECTSNPCRGGSTCVDAINTYICKCPRGRTGVNCDRRCDGQADVVFVIDASGSIRENRFQAVLDYVVNVTRELEVAPDRVRVGVIMYSDDAVVQFHLNSYTSKEDVLQAIRNFRWIQGRTHTAAALRLLRTDMFTITNGERPDVPNYAVVITDGQSNINEQMTIPEAIEAQIEGIHIITVSVAEKPGLEIKGIASDPDENNIFFVKEFSKLNTLQNPLIMSMCDENNECASNPCRNAGQCLNGLRQYICMCQDLFTGVNCERRCGRRMDVVFVLDASGSVEETFDLSLQLTREIIQGLNFAGGRTRVGVLTFADNPTIRFNLNKYSDKQSVLTATAFKQTNGRTDTAAGIDEMTNNMFTSSNGDRAGDDNHAIIITDGRSNINRQRTIPAADKARKAGITMIAVGIGKNGLVDRAELNGIANDPDNQYAHIFWRADQIRNTASKILDMLCQ